MEEALLRFPHLGVQIFENLDDSNLVKSRKLARSWLNFIDFEEMPWKRTQKNWERSMKDYPCKEGQTKLLVALVTGQNKMFEIIFQAEKNNLKSKNNVKDIPIRLKIDLKRITRTFSFDLDAITPFHLAAAMGNLNACQMMFNSFGNQDNNFWGWTPLHLAACNGHLDTCQFLLERLEEKKFISGFLDSTPLHEAASQGHLEVCQLIMKYIETSPSDMKNFFGQTPLNLAENSGHTTVVEYLSSLSKKRKCHQWIEKPKKQKKL